MRSVALNDDGGDVIVLREDGVNHGDVSRSDYHGVQDFLRDAAESLPGLGSNIVVPAMEVLVELYDFRLAGVCAGEP